MLGTLSLLKVKGPGLGAICLHSGPLYSGGLVSPMGPCWGLLNFATMHRPTAVFTKVADKVCHSPNFLLV